jgi:sialic acid synthase SpsE
MHKNTFTFGKRKIGAGQPCYLIAEVGTTCMGDMDKALRLVELAKNAGVDAIKFQVIDPQQVSDPNATYLVLHDGKEHRINMKEMFAKLTFSEDQWRRIVEACRKNGLDFFATVDYLDGVDMLDRLGVDAHKIGAWDSTYKQLITKIGETGKPMFADLGPTTEQQVHDIVNWYTAAGGSAVLFMHDFHTTDDTQMNLRAIQKLNEMFPWPAGFSSPAHDDDLDVAALALGAAYLEKRLILSRSEFAFHAHESLEPEELNTWVARIRHVERALGRPVIEPSDKDCAGSREYYRSICSLRDIQPGEVLSNDNVGAKRPGTGVPTSRMDEFIGCKASRFIAMDTLLDEKDLA